MSKIAYLILADPHQTGIPGLAKKCASIYESILLLDKKAARMCLVVVGQSELNERAEFEAPSIRGLKEIVSQSPFPVEASFEDHKESVKECIRVSMSHMVKFTRKLKYERKIFLLSDHFTMEDVGEDILNELEANNEIKLEVHRPSTPSSNPSWNGFVVPPVKTPTPAFLLQFSSLVKMNVQLQARTKVKAPPSLHKASRIILEKDPEALASTFQAVFKSFKNNPHLQVEPEQMQGAHYYGSKLVIFGVATDEAVTDYESPKGIQLLEFVKQDLVPRHYFLGDVDCVVGHSNDVGSQQGFKAMCLAMMETETVALVRFCRSEKKVTLAGLFPDVLEGMLVLLGDSCVYLIDLHTSSPYFSCLVNLPIIYIYTMRHTF